MKSLIELTVRQISGVEEQVRCQQRIVDELEAAGLTVEAQLARALLNAYQISPYLARQDLARYQASDRFQPHC
jgi:hypothetical protein